MKRKSKPRQKTPPPPALIERKLAGSRFVEFPAVQGKVVERIELSTRRDYHGITIYFRDDALLALNMEACFLVQPSLGVLSDGEIKVVEEWPPIRSSTELR